MRRKQDWMQLALIIVMMALLVLDKITAREAADIIRTLPLCAKTHGGPIRLDARSISITLSRSAVAVGNCCNNFVSPSRAVSRTGIQRATAINARATIDSGSKIVSRTVARMLSARSTACFNSSHSPSFPSQHLHALMNSEAVAPVSARA